MRCPHCYRPTKVHSTTNAVGIVMRVRDCHACKRRYRTEEKPIQELDMPSKNKPHPDQRRMERALWHERNK